MLKRLIGGKKRVLLAEDDEHIRRLMTKHLEFSGYAVETAADGDEALQLLEKKNYDLLFTDLMMPKINGVQLIKTCRQSDRDLPIVIVSAKGGEQSEAKLKDHLGSAYKGVKMFKKPFSAVEVLNHIQTLDL